MSTKKTPSESLQSFWERFTKEMAEIDKEAKKERKELDKKLKKDREELKKKMKQEREELEKKMKQEREEFDKKLKKDREEREKGREEFDKKLKKEREEFDKKLKKEREEREKRLDKKFAELAESRKQTDAAIKKMTGHFDSQWGKLIEALVEGDLIKLLVERKVNVYRTATNVGIRYEDQRGKVQEGEVDILAVDTTHVVPVEVKSTLKVRDVNDFLKTLQIFKLACPEYKDKVVYGAVAYLKADERASVYAQKKGLFVIRATGSSSSIINAANFKAKAF